MPANAPRARHLTSRIGAVERHHPGVDTTDLRDQLAAVQAAERLRAAIPDSGVERWAERVAAALEPLTDTEAAALGGLAAALDARLIQGRAA